MAEEIKKEPPATFKITVDNITIDVPPGTTILNDPAQVKSQFNLITFNGRYSQMTYGGYHFSQLGTLYNLSLIYKF